MFDNIPTSFTHATDELRKLIIDNPGLPLLVFAGSEANIEDYNYTCCTNVRACLGEVLDCQQYINEEYIFTHRSDFEEELRTHMADEDEYADLSDKEFDEVVSAKLAEYEPYWKKCIIIYVDN